MVRLALWALILFRQIPAYRPTSHYASTSGSRAGNGSITQPWDLATALSGAGGRVHPGDTVWVRGGTYYAPFRSTLTGSAGAPIVVRGYPGERAIIDGVNAPSDNFVVAGAWSVVWGLEFTNTNPARTAPTAGSVFRTVALVNNGPHNKYINNIVHDGGTAYYTYANHVDVEIYGNIWYNNGWQGPDRGHGHALYLKNDVGPVVARDNIIFNQFGYGVHVYSEPGDGQLINIRVEGNVAFNNGTLSLKSKASNILVGGGTPADAIVARDNMTYYSPGVAQVNARFGWRNAVVRNGGLTLTGNYFVGGSVVLDVHAWRETTVSGNTLYGPGAAPVVQLDDAVMGLDPTNRVFRDPPTGWQVFVRPNAYEPGRANVVVYNWARGGSVRVDLSGVLHTGDRYEVRNVQGLFGPPVASGVYAGGALSIPMSGVAPPAPIGGAPAAPPRTAPEFDVFIVSKVASSAARRAGATDTH
jgi:hypothetical protein